MKKINLTLVIDALIFIALICACSGIMYFWIYEPPLPEIVTPTPIKVIRIIPVIPSSTSTYTPSPLPSPSATPQTTTTKTPTTPPTATIRPTNTPAPTPTSSRVLVVENTNILIRDVCESGDIVEVLPPGRYPFTRWEPMYTQDVCIRVGAGWFYYRMVDDDEATFIEVNGVIVSD